MALRSSLWMGDLEMYMNESFITNAFHQAGENITGVKIMKNRSNGSPLGYGFIEFPDHDAAQRCMSKLNGKVIPGTTPPKRFRLNPVHGKEHGIVSEYSLFVGDLTNDVDEYSLYRAFAKRYKSCFAAKIVVDNTGVSKGFGFVRFFDEGDQQKALIEMQHMTKVGQRPLRVGLPKSKGASEVSEPYQYYPSYGVPFSKAYTWGGFTHYYHDYYNNANSTANAFQNYPQTQNYYEQDGDDMEALEDPCLEVDVDSLNKEYMEQSEGYSIKRYPAKWAPSYLEMHGISNKRVFVFEQSFTDHSHTGSIRCVAISEKGILASGSTDETINLLNLAKRKEMGSLMHHSGTVNCLKFHEGSHMFSCSDDKTVCVWKCNKWECLRTFRGHKKAVNCVSVHPSGKLALSVGTDRSLHTWNLVTGRSAYITNIKEEGEIVIWSSDGNYYAIIVNTKIDIYKVETASIHCKIQSTRRINTATFIDNTVLAYGGEGGELILHDVVKDEQLTSIDTETTRIKSLVSICSFIDHVTPWLISASSDGYIKVFRANKRESGWNIVKLAEHDTKFRLLCVAAVDISKYLGIKTEKLKEGSKLTGVKEELSETEDILPPIEIKEESDSDNEESSSEEPIPVKKKKKNPSAELESKKKSQRKDKLKNNKKKKKSSLS